MNSRTTYLVNGYMFHINKKLVQNVRINLPFKLGYNYDGVFKELVLQPGFSLSMIGQTMINVSYMAVNRERFGEVLFEDVNRTTFSVRSAPVKGIALSLSGQYGMFIYRTATPVPGKGYNITASLTLEPTSRLKTSFTWSAAKLNDKASNAEFYNGHIFRNITTFQFNTKLNLRNIIQYNTFSKKLSIYPLITYRFNAFTMFCAGMTQDMMDYDQPD